VGLHGGQQKSEHNCLKLNSSIALLSVFFMLLKTAKDEFFPPSEILLTKSGERDYGRGKA
jgi:hypothetical protein